MKIDCELTKAESVALAFVTGYATAEALRDFKDAELAQSCARLMNKLFAKSPDYIPYDENSFDPNTTSFPFKRITPQ